MFQLSMNKSTYCVTEDIKAHGREGEALLKLSPTLTPKKDAALALGDADQ